MRPLVAVALTAALGLAVPGHSAVTKPQIVDPAGDAMPPISAGYDIVSALFRTDGITVKAGRRTAYTPTRLVVTTTYAGNVPADEYAAQVVSFDLPGCANVYLQRYADGLTYGTGDCFATESFTFPAKVTGRTVTFTIPFATVGTAYLRRGTVVTRLRTYTALSEPTQGFETAELGAVVGAGTVDDASSSASYRVG